MNAIICLCLLVSVYAAPSKLARTCGGKPADVVFVIDSSSSIWEYDFKTHVLPFVRDVTSMFDVGPSPTQSRVGVVTFGDNYYLRFHLNRHMDKDYLMKRIMTIGQTGGNTNTAGALNYVTDRMFVTKNGMRPDVDHIVIILTDGESMNYQKTKEAASRAHKRGLQVFAIGVGDAVDDVELSDIASDPDTQFKFHATDFQALQRIKEELAIKTCEVPTTTVMTTTEPTTTTEPPTTPVNVQNDKPMSIKSCGGKPADVYFILDSSSSIWPKDFSNKMLKFVKEVSEIFDIGSKKTRVGVVTFSDDYKPIFGLNTYSDSKGLLEALSPENIPFMSGGTNTADAIKYVRETGFSPKVARPDVAHVAVIITDGMSMDPEATMLEAEAAKKSGIYMFAIGVGDSVDQNELIQMASQPSKDYVFNVNNFGALDTIKNLLAMKTCLVNSGGEEIPRDQEYQCGFVSSDIVFGFDSFAMGQTLSHRVVDIITTATNKISSGDNRFSVLSNACSKHRDIPMTDIREAEQALGNMKEMMSSQLHNIIKKLRRYAFGPRNNARAGMNKVAVLFIDELTGMNRDAVIANAKRARATGVELFVVTLGQVDQSLVQEIASKPVKSHLIQVQSDDNVSDISEHILSSLC